MRSGGAVCRCRGRAVAALAGAGLYDFVEIRAVFRLAAAELGVEFPPADREHVWRCRQLERRERAGRPVLPRSPRKCFSDLECLILDGLRAHACSAAFLAHAESSPAGSYDAWLADLERLATEIQEVNPRSGRAALGLAWAHSSRAYGAVTEREVGILREAMDGLDSPRR